jgi:hypothetical protein
MHFRVFTFVILMVATVNGIFISKELNQSEQICFKEDLRTSVITQQGTS